MENYTCTVEDLKTLRARTKLGMKECKDALEATNGDIEKAIDHLKKKGLLDMMAGKDKIATEGLVYAYIHTNGRIGVLVEINCQTDFVARTEEFKQFCKDITMQIAGNNPPAEYVEDKDIPGLILIKQLGLFQQKTMEEKNFGGDWNDLPTPQKLMVDKIASGRLTKWKKDVCLLDQKFIKDPNKDIKALLAEIRQSTGEQVKIRRFTRYELGEGLVKKTEDFATEVAKAGGFTKPTEPATPTVAQFSS